MRVIQRWTGQEWVDATLDDFALGNNYIKIIERDREPLSLTVFDEVHHIPLLGPDRKTLRVIPGGKG